MTAAEGIHEELPIDEYLAHPALSSSGAKRLLPPSTPAEFHYWRQQPPERKPAFDEGHAVHGLLLGGGQPLVRLPFDDLRSKDARAARDEAYDAGAVPLMPDRYDLVHAMADAVRAHPLAAGLLNADTGRGEVSAITTDPGSGVQMRCRYDWLPRKAGKRLLIPDVKTTDGLDDASIAKTMATYSYHMAAEWYLRIAGLLGLATDLAWLWIWVSKRPPHLVRVTQLEHADQQLAERLNDLALETYRECTETGHWPAYPAVGHVGLPSWATYRAEELLTV